MRNEVQQHLFILFYPSKLNRKSHRPQQNVTKLICTEREFFFFFFLAFEASKNGRSTKRIIRQIVTSSTKYRFCWKQIYNHLTHKGKTIKHSKEIYKIKTIGNCNSNKYYECAFRLLYILFSECFVHLKWGIKSRSDGGHDTHTHNE